MVNSVYTSSVHGATPLHLWLSSIRVCPIILWTTICTTVLDLGYHPGSWPGSKISYHIAIRNPTLTIVCVTVKLG